MSVTPAALMAAGTALSVMGQYQANLAQAKAELRNSAWYREQAAFAFQAGIREAEIAKSRYTATKGAQVSAYARGNVDISGSAAGVIADTVAKMHAELRAIDLKTRMEYSLASQRARASEETANLLSDPIFNLTQAGGTALTNYTKSIDSGSAPSFTGGPSKEG